jgi:hypothetical protein
VVYGQHVLEKMKGFVEFQDVVDVPDMVISERQAVEAF